jgi:hypothetical protein
MWGFIMLNRLNDSEFLLKRLVLPLAVLAVFSLIVSFFIIKQSYYITWKGLFLNLGVTSLGIIITLSYVNWILNEHENRKWKDVQISIHNRIKRYLIGTIITFRVSFGFDLNVYSSDFMEAFDLTDSYTDVSPEFCEEIINIGEDVLRPVISLHIKNMSQEEWFQFAKNIEVLQEEIVRIVDLFLVANKIEPNLFSDLLQIEDEIDAFIKFYYAIPNFYGVPDERIPNKEVLKYKSHIYDNMGKYIDNIISLTVGLLTKMD